MSAEPEPGPHSHAGGRCSSLRELARVCAAEALGTALLVLLTAPAATPAATPALPAPLLAALVVAALVQCFGGISGAQLNPCVSLAALVRRRMSVRRALGELAAQAAGAVLAAVALPDARAALSRAAPHAPTHRVLAAEALCGAVLALANCAQWERARGAGTWPLRIAATVGALAAFAGEVSGGGMNPARSFGPALVAAHWERHWVYWAGPLGGAGAAAALYGAAWAGRARRVAAGAPLQTDAAAAAALH